MVVETFDDSTAFKARLRFCARFSMIIGACDATLIMEMIYKKKRGQHTISERIGRYIVQMTD